MSTAGTGFNPISTLTGSSSGSSPNVTVTANGGLSIPGGAAEGQVVNFSLKDQSGIERAAWSHTLTPMDIGHSNFQSPQGGLSLAGGMYNLYASITSGGSSEAAGPAPVLVSSG
jgi:hypothetical protein